MTDQTLLDSPVSSRLVAILSDIKKIDPADIALDPDDDFLAVLNIDSLDSVQLTMKIAAEFGFNFGEDVEDIEALDSFGRLTALIETRMRGA